MWIWLTKPGVLALDDKKIATGYSGYGIGKNNPVMWAVPRIGPIPEGAYWIDGPRDTPTHGPHVLPLVPVHGNEMHGRSGFLIHGDSSEHPGEASEGCIILPRPIRELISKSGDSLLVVLSGNEAA